MNLVLELCSHAGRGGSPGVFALAAQLSAIAYVLLSLTALVTILFLFWRMHRKQINRLNTELTQSQKLAKDRERERDLAQEELFRRLYEERELNKDKVQFQS